jgi:hypothetical protein
MKDRKFGDKGYGKRCGILICMLDDSLTVNISCVHPAAEATWGVNKRAGMTKAAREKGPWRVHARDRTSGYTIAPSKV